MMGLGDMVIAFNTVCSKVFEKVEESVDVRLCSSRWRRWDCWVGLFASFRA